MVRKELVSELLKIKNISNKTVNINGQKLIKIFSLNCENLKWNDDILYETVALWKNFFLSLNFEVEIIISSKISDKSEYDEYLYHCKDRLNETDGEQRDLNIGQLNSFNEILSKYVPISKQIYILIHQNIVQDKYTHIFKYVFNRKLYSAQKIQKEQSYLKRLNLTRNKVINYFERSKILIKELDDYDIHEFIYNTLNLKAK